jgi:hypothetical protein
MRKFILIAGFVLASATAQAGETRSLSLLGSDPLAAPAPVKAVYSSQTAQAPQVTEAPKAEAPKEAPKYIERPAVVEPNNNDLTGLENTKPAVTKTASAPRAEKPRRQRYWTEGRIISELHRYGIYW